MGKQRKILIEIIKLFQFTTSQQIFLASQALDAHKKMRKLFFSSLNKSDLIRKILNEVVLSDEEILTLLRILFKKESEF